jgi:hypothetical protein
MARTKATASPERRLILLTMLCFVFITVSFFLIGFATLIFVDCSIAGNSAGNGMYVLFLYHFPAFFSTFVTGFSALLTMLHFVFGTFITARLTNLSAERAEFSGER